MTPTFAAKTGTTLYAKKEPFPLCAIDGKPVEYNSGVVDQETGRIPLAMGRHREKLRFDITDTPGSDVVLGLPWLKNANPVIDWRNEKISFSESMKSMPLSAVHDALDMIDICAMTAAETRQRIQEEPENVQILWSRQEICAAEPTPIPAEYKEFEELFREESDQEALPEHQSWDHEIKLMEGKEPTKQAIYPLSAEKLEALRTYLEENLRKGFIRESQSPAGYPILFVPKPDGSLRLCVDYRGLNNITIKNSYPLPLISELQDRLQGAQWFTKFDIPAAYNRIRMKHGEEWKTAFRTRFGHYEYLVMPFGLTNAPATFQAFINNVLRQHLDVFVTVYLDDILVYSKTKEEHVKHVRLVLKALQQARLRLKPKKCEFHVQEVQFLGYIITRNGLKMDQSKVTAVTSWPTPTSVKEVQSFLGFANFYRRFINGYSRITTPLTSMTKKDQGFEWTKEANDAFEELKQRFTTQPVLAMFDPEKPITVETDASDAAIGACLSQPDEQGRLHPIAFHSRKFSPAELNYEIHDKELLAIVDAFKQWKVYLEGPKHQVKVYTDHKNLLYFTTTKSLNRRQVRWSEELSSYNFQIIYRKGSENAKADALSRRTDYLKDKPKTIQAILRTDTEGNLEYNRHVIAATLTIENRDFENKVRQALEQDTIAAEIMSDPENHQGFQVYNRLLLFEGLIYVPTKCRQELVDNFHSSQIHGHQGIDKTLERITRTYYFPGIRKYVEEFIRKCDICRRTKHDRHRPYGLMKSPTTPPGAWTSIALDWIVKLPLSEEPVTKVKYDSILVITDRLTKYAYFLPYKETASTEDLAYTFLRNIVANHAMPKEIISDRDKLLKSNFWKSLTTQLGINHKLSTSYHPQTDGQTERLNQTLEQYLRCYINYQQDNWVRLLPVAQLAYNSAKTETTSVSPFFANYGFEPTVRHEPREFGFIAEAATVAVEQLQELHAELQKDIKFLSTRASIYYNRKRARGPTLKEGDKVYLLRRNIKTKRPSDKLDYTKLGPFRIRKVKGPVNYELELPARMRIHPVFHISLLEPADTETPIQDTPPGIDPESQNADYEIERILDDKLIRGKRHYLVKWKGYDDTENTWEPTEHFNSLRVLWQYRQNRESPRRSQASHPTRSRSEEKD